MGMFVRSAHFALLVSWFALTLGVWWVVTNSFATFDARTNPAAAELFEDSATRKLKGRMAAREVNARIFRTWNDLQLGFCALLFALLWGSRRAGAPSLVLAGLLLLIVGVHAFWFSPKIEALGRALVSPSPPEASVARAFGRYHGAYVVGDVAKACLLLAAMWFSPWRTRGRAQLD